MAQLLGEAARPVCDFVRIGAGQRILILRAADARRDLNILHALERCADLRKVGGIGLQSL